MKMRQRRIDKYRSAIRIFKRNGGILRLTNAVEKGISKDIVYSLKKLGEIERVARGLYRLSDSPLPSYSDYAILTKKIPNGIICLISSLSYFQITTQVAHEIHIALEKKSKLPLIEYPPIRIYKFSKANFLDGVEIHKVGKGPVKIYCPERTIMDCFKYRNKIGLNIAIEALKLYRKKMPIRMDLLERYARLNRVFRIVKPYLEAII
jgi:predicted transcriptional regulator of viral defense system